MKKALLIGASPLTNESFIKNFLNDKFTFVAIDGGYDYFLKNGIEPDILIGDFDTFDENKIGSVKQIIKLNPIKDDTDTFYIIKKLILDGYEEFYIFGCLGGKIDHTIANIQILRYLTNQNIKAYLFFENKCLTSLKRGTLSFSKNSKGFISIFSLSDSSKITLKGFKYNIDNYILTNDTPIGISNEFTNKPSTIEIMDGSIMFYTDATNIKII